MGMELRPYQQEAEDAILNEWDNENRKRTLLVLPTGTGKTIVFAKVAEDRVKRGDRVLILAHRGELLEQARDKINKSTGLSCALEKAESSCIGAPERIVVGSIQSLQQVTRLCKFEQDYFDDIIVDEAHHVMSDSYQRVLKYFANANVLGVTATPDRGDMKNLGNYFDSLAYEYTLSKAIREGYLCPIRAFMIPLQIDMSHVGVQAGDFRESDLGDALEPYMEQIADEMALHCMNRKTVVFLPLIRTSQKFRDVLQSRGFRAAEVNGNSPDRAEILSDFENGKYNVLCNSMLLTEGWDCPSVDCIVVLRPTKIRSLYAQMVGRGTRLCEGKDFLLLLDFLWMSERHELCRPACLIADNEETAKMMNSIMEENPETEMDIEELQKEASSDIIKQREAALAKQLEEMRHKKKTLMDPLQFEMSIQDEDLINYTPSFGWEMKDPTEKQLSYLESLGIDTGTVKLRGKASMLIDRLKKRRSEQYATPRQIKTLESRGFRNVGMWSKESASNMISRISDNYWHIPRGVTPKTYLPPELVNMGYDKEMERL